LSALAGPAVGGAASGLTGSDVATFKAVFLRPIRYFCRLSGRTYLPSEASGGRSA